MRGTYSASGSQQTQTVDMVFTTTHAALAPCQARRVTRKHTPGLCRHRTVYTGTHASQGPSGPWSQSPPRNLAVCGVREPVRPRDPAVCGLLESPSYSLLCMCAQKGRGARFCCSIPIEASKLPCPPHTVCLQHSSVKGEFPRTQSVFCSYVIYTHIVLSCHPDSLG